MEKIGGCGGCGGTKRRGSSSGEESQGKESGGDAGGTRTGGEVSTRGTTRDSARMVVLVVIEQKTGASMTSAHYWRTAAWR